MNTKEHKPSYLDKYPTIPQQLMKNMSLSPPLPNLSQLLKPKNPLIMKLLLNLEPYFETNNSSHQYMPTVNSTAHPLASSRLTTHSLNSKESLTYNPLATHWSQPHWGSPPTGSILPPPYPQRNTQTLKKTSEILHPMLPHWSCQTLLQILPMPPLPPLQTHRSQHFQRTCRVLDSHWHFEGYKGGNVMIFPSTYDEPPSHLSELLRPLWPSWTITHAFYLICLPILFLLHSITFLHLPMVLLSNSHKWYKYCLETPVFTSLFLLSNSNKSTSDTAPKGIP